MYIRHLVCVVDASTLPTACSQDLCCHLPSLQSLQLQMSDLTSSPCICFRRWLKVCFPCALQQWNLTFRVPWHSGDVSGRRPPTKNSRIFVNTTFKVMQLLQKQVAVCHFKVNAKQLSADRIHPKSGRTELHIPLFLFLTLASPNQTLHTTLHSGCTPRRQPPYQYVFFTLIYHFQHADLICLKCVFDILIWWDFSKISWEIRLIAGRFRAQTKESAAAAIFCRDSVVFGGIY